MPVPIAVAIAATVTRALAAQAAKQGVKQLTKNEARIVAKKAVRQIAAKSRSQSDKSRAVSGKQLDALINKANLSARSTKPVRNAKGLRTTTGQGGKRISNVSATRIAEQSAGPKARRLGGEAGLRAVAPKPGVRVTTRTSRGTTTTRPVKRETNKKGSAITIRKTQPRKPAEVRAQRAKERRDTLREALTPRVNPARPKTTPKRGTSGSSGRNRTPSQDVLDRYYRIRFGDRGGPTPRSAQGPQSSIESRLASGSEKAPKGSSRSSNFDSEAESLLSRSIRAIENPKVAAKERVTPGKATKTTIALRTVGGTKGAKAAKLKGTIRNQRKVLKQREIKEAAERMRKAEEAAKKRGTK
jgi:hypothetical protein